MEKNFFAILGLATVFFAASCSKSDSNLAATPKATATASAKGVAIATTIEGKWVGNHHSGIDGAYYYFSLEFLANGVLLVNSSFGDMPVTANGTWSLTGDDVSATYTFDVSGATYSLAGKFYTTSNIMNGTIGFKTNTTGAGVFSVTKE